MNKFFSFLGFAAMLVFLASASSCSDTPEARAEAPVRGQVPGQATALTQDADAEENVAPSTHPKRVPAGESEADKEWEAVKDQAMKSGKVKIETPMGDITVMLYDETPMHKENFLKLAYTGFYEDLLWHRVMKGFMCQGGDPQSRGAASGQRLGTGGPGYTVPAEIKTGLIHKKGALAAARQPDGVNPKKASSGSQFYIVQGRPFARAQFEQSVIGGNARRPEGQHVAYTEEQLKGYETEGGYPPLDGEYTVFGEVVEGLDVLDKIAAVSVDRNNRPMEDVTMKMTVLGLK